MSLPSSPLNKTVVMSREGISSGSEDVGRAGSIELADICAAVPAVTEGDLHSTTPNHGKDPLPGHSAADVDTFYDQKVRAQCRVPSRVPGYPMVV